MQRLSLQWQIKQKILALVALNNNLKKRGSKLTKNGEYEWNKHARGIHWVRPSGTVPPRLPGALVHVAPPASVPLRCGLPGHRPWPPRLRRHRRSARRFLTLHPPHRRRPRRASRRFGNRVSFFGGSWLGSLHSLAFLLAEARSCEGPRQFERRVPSQKP